MNVGLGKLQIFTLSAYVEHRPIPGEAARKIQSPCGPTPLEALLAKNGETNIHTQNLRMLMIEIYKTLNNTNSLLQEYFIRKDVKYDLRIRDLLQIPAAKSITFGIDPIKF